MTEEDLTSLPVHHCYVRATVGGDKLPTFSMALRPPDAGDETAAEAVLQRVSEYTLSREVVTTRLEREVEKHVAAFRKELRGGTDGGNAPRGSNKKQRTKGDQPAETTGEDRATGADEASGQTRRVAQTTRPPRTRRRRRSHDYQHRYTHNPR